MNKYDKILFKKWIKNSLNIAIFIMIMFVLAAISYMIMNRDMYRVDCQDQECSMSYSHDHRP